MYIISNPTVHRCDLPPLLINGWPRLDDENGNSVALEVGAIIGCDGCEATYELTWHKASELLWRQQL